MKQKGVVVATEAPVAKEVTASDRMARMKDELKRKSSDSVN
ncbi:hypothetical protein [Psychrobacillus sp. OK032]|nr:hypothetical protein [Psychrobacillus sp. OK032]